MLLIEFQYKYLSFFFFNLQRFLIHDFSYFSIMKCHYEESVISFNGCLSETWNQTETDNFEDFFKDLYLQKWVSLL